MCVAWFAMIDPQTAEVNSVTLIKIKGWGNRPQSVAIYGWVPEFPGAAPVRLLQGPLFQASVPSENSTRLRPSFFALAMPSINLSTDVIAD